MEILNYRKGERNPSEKRKVYFCGRIDDVYMHLDEFCSGLYSRHLCTVWYAASRHTSRDEKWVAELKTMQAFVVAVTSVLLDDTHPEVMEELAVAEEHQIPVLLMLCEHDLEKTVKQHPYYSKFPHVFIGDFDDRFPYIIIKKSAVRFDVCVARALGDEDSERLAVAQQHFIEKRTTETTWSLLWCYLNFADKMLDKASEQLAYRMHYDAFRIAVDFMDDPPRKLLFKEDIKPIRRLREIICDRLDAYRRREEQRQQDTPACFGELEELLGTVSTPWTTEDCRKLWEAFLKCAEYHEEVREYEAAHDKYSKAVDCASDVAKETGLPEDYRAAIELHIKYGDFCRTLENYQAANICYENAVRMALENVEKTGSVENRRALIKAYERFATGVAVEENDFEYGETKLKEIADILCGVAEETGAVEDRRALAEMHETVAIFASANNNPKESGDAIQKALDIRLALEKETGDVQDARKVADTYGTMGCFAEEDGDLEAAQKYFEEELRLRLILMEGMNDIKDRQAVIASYSSLGRIAIQRGDILAAKQHFENSLNIAEELSNDDKTAYEDIARYSRALGKIALEMGDIEAAKIYKKKVQVASAIAAQITEADVLKHLKLGIECRKKNKAMANEDFADAVELLDGLCEEFPNEVRYSHLRDIVGMIQDMVNEE